MIAVPPTQRQIEPVLPSSAAGEGRCLIRLEDRLGSAAQVGERLDQLAGLERLALDQAEQCLSVVPAEPLMRPNRRHDVVQPIASASCSPVSMATPPQAAPPGPYSPPHRASHPTARARTATSASRAAAFPTWHDRRAAHRSSPLDLRIARAGAPLFSYLPVLLFSAVGHPFRAGGTPEPPAGSEQQSCRCIGRPVCGCG